MKKVNVGVTAAHLSEAGVVTVGSQSTGSGRWPKYVAVSGRSLHVHARHGTKVVADIQMMLRLHVTAAIGIDER